MNIYIVTFIVGVVAVVTRADVSHLKNFNSMNSVSNHGNTKNSPYWWMNTETSPFSSSRNNIGGGGVHNTLHKSQQQHNYINDQFRNNFQQNTYRQSTTLSGSPLEINNLSKENINIVAQPYQTAPKIPCYGATQVCAPKDACESGFISEKNLGLVLSQSNNCDSQLESCCNIQPNSDDDSTPCDGFNEACITSMFCFNGVMDQSVEHKASKATNGLCVAPEVCCRFSDRKRQAPAYTDSDFAAASTSEVLTKEGYVVKVPSNQYLPSLPEFNPDASNTDSSRIKPEVRPQPQQPTPPPQRPIAPQQPIAPQPIAPQRPITPVAPPPYQSQGSSPPPVRIAPVTPRPYQPAANQPRPSVVTQDQAVAPIVPAGCPAAMNCTQIDYCSATAVISKTPVVLTEFQKAYRVPMTDCTIMPSRELGKCCRDPDYTDPWPIGRSGVYNADELNAVFDSGSYKPERQNGAASKRAIRVQPNEAVATSNQVVSRVSAPVNQQQIVSQPRPYREIQSTQASCGVRNYNTQPRGKAPLGTGFSEFTWTAMIILESRKALLCGGSIIDRNVVVTSASCVQGNRDNDVLIKAGEWRLGSDEEPKPFQIVRVQKIVFHPKYQAQSPGNDIALLFLENDIKYDTHIGPICLDEAATVSSPNDNCVTTGWGKEVLKVHLGNALMQHTPVSVLHQADCQSRLESSNFVYSDSLVCGVTQQDACEVDVGSALACTDRSGRYTLKGIYSTETACNDPNQVVAYTRTDLQWIRDALRNTARY